MKKVFTISALLLGATFAQADTSICKNEIQSILSNLSQVHSDCTTVESDIAELESMNQNNQLDVVCSKAPQSLRRQAILTSAFLRKELALAYRTKVVCERGM